MSGDGTATIDDRLEWFARGVTEGATHLVVVCDTFSYEDYPVYVKPGENVYEVVTKYDGPNMQRVHEVFHLGSDRDAQMVPGRRAMNYDRLEQPPAEKMCSLCAMPASAPIHIELHNRHWHRFQDGPPPVPPLRMGKNGYPILPKGSKKRGRFTVIQGGKKS